MNMLRNIREKTKKEHLEKKNTLDGINRLDTAVEKIKNLKG